jgi:hypothetical protein
MALVHWNHQVALLTGRVLRDSFGGSGLSFFPCLQIFFARVGRVGACGERSRRDRVRGTQRRWLLRRDTLPAINHN